MNYGFIFSDASTAARFTGLESHFRCAAFFLWHGRTLIVNRKTTIKDAGKVARGQPVLFDLKSGSSNRCSTCVTRARLTPRNRANSARV